MRTIVPISIMAAAGALSLGCAATQAVAAGTDGVARLPLEVYGREGGYLRYDGVYYDWVDHEGLRGIKLWVPPGTGVVRGILLHGNPGSGGDTRSMARDPGLQEFAVRFRFGIAGVTVFRGREVFRAGGAVMLRVLEEWAALGFHPELRHAPLIARGSSNAGVTAYALACLTPERMICFTPNVGPSYSPAQISDAALKVPGWMHVGPRDPFFTNGIEDTRALFAEARPRGARWAWDAEKDKAHEIGHIDDVDMAFYAACIALRLPKDADPRRGPVRLRDIPEDAGWLADPASWTTGIVAIAPFKEYQGDKTRACWLPTRDMAFLYRAIATHDRPLALRIEGVQHVLNPHASGVELRSIGGSLALHGRTLRLVCNPGSFVQWTQIEFFDGAEKIGEVRAGQAPVCEVSVDRAQPVYAFSALAHDAAGAVRTSPPAHVIVSAPDLAKLLAAQRDATERWAPPAGTRPAWGSACTAQPPCDAHHALPAWALSAVQEQQFARDGLMTPFWNDIRSTNGCLVLDAASAVDDQTAAAKHAGVIVKMAHSRAGLYLYAEVSASPAGSGARAGVLDLHIARDSSERIWAAGPTPDVFAKPAALSLVRSAVQYQIPVNPTSWAKAAMSWNYPDPWEMARKTAHLAELERTYGIIVDYGRARAGRTAIECFLPWAYVGSGAPIGEPAAGTRLGVIVGYDEFDGVGGARLSLRWPNGIDPWQRAAADSALPRPWADLVLCGALPVVRNPQTTTTP